MENNYFKRIEINGDVNRLPEKEDYYFVRSKKYGKKLTWFDFKSYAGIATSGEFFGYHSTKEYWLENIEWYLLPVPSPDVIVGLTEEQISDYAGLQVSRYLKAKNDPSVDLHRRFRSMAKYALSQLKIVNLKDELVKFGTKERSRARDICMDFYRRKKNEELRQCGNTIIGRTGLSDESETIMQIMKVVVEDYMKNRENELLQDNIGTP